MTTDAGRARFATGLALLLIAALGIFMFCACAPSQDDGGAGEATVQQPISGSFAGIDNTGTFPIGDWIRAVGQLQFVPGGMFGNCSGTLVAPGVVLTAGHCFQDLPAQDPGEFVIPNAPPLNGAVQGNGYHIASWIWIPGSNVNFPGFAWTTDRPHDVACAFLASNVPRRS